jgi:hypothetical protein
MFFARLAYWRSSASFTFGRPFLGPGFSGQRSFSPVHLAQTSEAWSPSHPRTADSTSTASALLCRRNFHRRLYPRKGRVTMLGERLQ